MSCLGLFATQLDITVVNLALRGIADGLHASAATVSWVVDAYLVCFAAFILGFGVVGDAIGRARVLRLGVAGFASASIGCALASSAGALIASRAAQGTAAAAVVVSSLALLAEHFDADRRTRAIGLWTAVAGLSLVLGPVAGGAMVSTLGWRSLFWLNVPIGVATLGTSCLVPSTTRPRERRSLDWQGQTLATAALGACAWGVSVASRGGFAWSWGWLVLAGGLLLGGALVVVERSRPEPLIPFAIFKDRRLTGATIASALVNFSTLGLLYLLSLDLEVVDHLNAAAAGLSVLPLFGSYVLWSSLAGRVSARLGLRRCVTAGLAVSAGAGALLSKAIGDGGLTYVELAALGAGVGLSLPPLVSVAVGALPTQRVGFASGLNNTARQIGGTFGVALLGGVAAGAGTSTGRVRAAVLLAALGYVLAALAGNHALGRPGGGRRATASEDERRGPARPPSTRG